MVNVMHDTTFDLKWDLFEKPALYDVLINELMPDPDPAVALPNIEFIELYNHSGKYLQLEGSTLSDKTTITTLPPLVLMPDSFVILCEAGNDGTIAPGRTNQGGVNHFSRAFR